MDVMQHTGNPLATPKNQRAAHPGVLLILVRGWGGGSVPAFCCKELRTLTERKIGWSTW